MIKQRFPALDIMRGLTLALMILVNNPGSWSYVYAPLLHADWHGFTPTDFIFPFFLFMVGAALFFSQRSLMLPHVTAGERHKKIIRRTLLLFAIGFFLNIFPFVKPLDEARILGVLQRIALAYMFAAFIVLYAGDKLRWLIGAILLLGYWALLQISDQPYSLEGSIVRQFDLFVLGANHMWQGKGIPFDPEGLLSTLPSIVNVLLGYEVARILTQGNNVVAAQKKLAGLGVALIVLALIWNIYFPINKSLWTSPFVLLTSGVGIFVLLALVLLERTPAKPLLNWFTPFGRNPLFIYALAFMWSTMMYTLTIGDQSWYDWLYQQLCRFLNLYNASLAFALLHVLLFWCVAKYMDRKNITISL
ncbi:membrane protein [Cellvibrio zantedeschiae]|uniref:Membrane protein n=1 Tax=Cellvibrio zantedeschiae TaxID=1237077 RepID=A0ABQ3AQR6_9GAMM|nr:heparan-alpha-glucosaminide N-acetyltransferase domain-containing protein [Cellvibrio zantedeschiae]GGY62417.1 membrane protein [Cellvibrio zantedeschiae]